MHCQISSLALLSLIFSSSLAAPQLLTDISKGEVDPSTEFEPESTVQNPLNVGHVDTFRTIDMPLIKPEKASRLNIIPVQHFRMAPITQADEKLQRLGMLEDSQENLSDDTEELYSPLDEHRGVGQNMIVNPTGGVLKDRFLDQPRSEFWNPTYPAKFSRMEPTLDPEYFIPVSDRVVRRLPIRFAEQHRKFSENLPVLSQVVPTGREEMIRSIPGDETMVTRLHPEVRPIIPMLAAAKNDKLSSWPAEGQFQVDEDDQDKTAQADWWGGGRGWRGGWRGRGWRGGWGGGWGWRGGWGRPWGWRGGCGWGNCGW